MDDLALVPLQVEDLWSLCMRDVVLNLKERIPKLAPEKHLALKTETDVFCAAMKDLGPLFRYGISRPLPSLSLRQP